MILFDLLPIALLGGYLGGACGNLCLPQNGNRAGYQDVPVETVVIESVKRIEPKA